MSKTIFILLKVISIIPLIFYPFVILANVMSLAGYRSGNESSLLLFAMYAFMFVSTLYPLSVFISFRYAKDKNIGIALLPLLHLALCALLMYLWEMA